MKKGIHSVSRTSTASGQRISKTLRKVAGRFQFQRGRSARNGILFQKISNNFRSYNLTGGLAELSRWLGVATYGIGANSPSPERSDHQMDRTSQAVQSQIRA